MSWFSSMFWIVCRDDVVILLFAFLFAVYSDCIRLSTLMSAAIVGGLAAWLPVLESFILYYLRVSSPMGSGKALEYTCLTYLLPPVMIIACIGATPVIFCVLD